VPDNNELFSDELSVSALTNQIKQTLNNNFTNLNIVGEVSNFRPSSIGHWYFTLKDKEASISAVMFKTNTWKSERPLKDGDQIVVSGSLDVYPPRGSYQIICTNIKFVGLGNILAQLEERKRQYAKAGWFDAQYKKPICKIPKKLGIVTSPTTAALQDVLQVLDRRAPSLDVIIIPAVVQGANAGKTISKAIDIANEYMLCDQLIVTRGGGSIEDLLPFSEDCVLHSILVSEIPVISGVGHEIDWALSDFVADLRAPTPSAAAELASSGIFDSIEKNRELKFNIVHNIENKISFFNERALHFDKNILQTLILNKIDSLLFRMANSENDIERSIDSKVENTTFKNLTFQNEIQKQIEDRYTTINYKFKDTQNNIAHNVESKITGGKVYLSTLNSDMANNIERKIDQKAFMVEKTNKEVLNSFENRINYINQRNIDLQNFYLTNIDKIYQKAFSSYNLTNTELLALSPISILDRGFSIVHNKKGKIISSTNQVEKDDLLDIKLKDGTINVKVE
jgi:exodeoxyribonuclease VII large subunit